MLYISNIINYFNRELDGYATKNEINSWAYIVIEHLFGYSKADYICNYNQKISKSNFHKIFDIVKELKTYKPIQYIIGETEFFQLKFKLNNSTLIPRPETEELVSWILKHDFSSVLDIGTGSGCIAITIAKLTNSNVDAMDICDKALKIAELNAKINSVNVNFILNDILNTEKMPNYDVIVSNPPYVQKSDILKMNKNVTEFEPHRAIFVDDNNPIVFYRKIASLAIKSLNDGGYIFFEINELYHKEILNLLNKIGFVDITLKNDINDKPRMIKACKK
ncbi:MAG: protein-(glutamine-N5) methyltransferase, release factor-specific [Flavobacteriales bacterium]|nr:protein-(glutamine-N5) methyltransferase, release factor-specific [Flavobacteriales bacterium]